MSEGITTYSVTYCDKPRQSCAKCEKVIPLRSLSAAEIYRKSKSEKKKLAKHTWYHFKCWTDRPFTKDQKRVKKVVDQGVGASLATVSNAELTEQPAKTAKEQSKKIEKDDNDEEEAKPKNKSATADKKESKANSGKKKKNVKVDLTAGLTGVQSRPNEKVTKLGKRKAEAHTPKKDIPEVKLSKADQLELESITQEIQNVLKKAKSKK
ncbi:hypothetical protein BX666DRAFT_1877907 [Dichotomocladium elegans]|nr:hypothetical protein BX666DRAFT_1877907 [Dichotomocladium elegans]